MEGLRVVDLGCGYRWFRRWAADQGTHSVLGLDVSEKNAGEGPSQHLLHAIHYKRADLEQLRLPIGAFDLTPAPWPCTTSGIWPKSVNGR
jgi:2-polyprenyl-3-methyl-5-hydroxy-6-metoxy-1,4-benzoquinol methylase